MHKLRNSNDPTVLNEYLHCNNKPNKPRIHHRICEERCKKFKSCPYYNEWYGGYYGKKLEKPEPKPKRKKVVRRAKKKVKKKKLKVKVVSA